MSGRELSSTGILVSSFLVAIGHLRQSCISSNNATPLNGGRNARGEERFRRLESSALKAWTTCQLLWTYELKAIRLLVVRRSLG